MPEFMRRRRHAAVALAVVAALSLASRTSTAAAAEDPPPQSALDAQLFYQLLIGEIELREGDPGTAYQAVLDAARRTGDGQLFRRAMDIALQSRAGNEALAATRAWREADPKAADPLRLELQILAALNRMPEGVAPLQALLALTPPAERGGLIAALPRFFERATDKRQTAGLLDDVLTPFSTQSGTRTAALVARGRAWLAADEPDRALVLARQASATDPGAPGPALLAMDLRGARPEAEQIITDTLARPGVDPVLRLAYVRLLTTMQRLPEAIAQLETALKERPDNAAALLTLGALHLELRHLPEADRTLQRYLAMVAAAPATPASAPAATDEVDDADDGDTPRADQGQVQAWLMLAQVAELRGDFPAAEAWLGRIEDPQRALEVQARRATLLARQGQVDAALALLRRLPERNAADARAKLVAEAQLLREVKLFPAAFDTFARANERFPDDVDLLYEQAMVAEKINRMDEMERLLRRVIELKPDHGHAHNALGYSLADRSQRLPEARILIQRALELMPGDPFITDSLGWVEFRLGNHDEAVRLLRSAWATRPDTEIGAHLGEALWASGQRDEARRIWRQANDRDGSNEVLRETLARLQVGL